MRVQANSLTNVLLLLGQEDNTEHDIDLLMPFALVTAFRADQDPETNTTNLEVLKDKLKKAGLKVYEVRGNWLEPPPGSSLEESEHDRKSIRIPEAALFAVPGKSDTPFDLFRQTVIRHADEFGQNGAILSDGVSMWLQMSDGSRHELGDRMDVKAIEQAYQEMRGQKQHGFAFAARTKTNMLLAKLQKLIVGSMKFRDFKSHGGTSKMWIDPKNRPIPLDDMHYIWLRENAAYIRKAYKLPNMPEFGPRDEIPARLWALKNGFTRVNYTPNGTVTFETNKAFWDKKRQDVISMLIADNADQIDFIVVNVLNDDGSIYKDGTADVRGLDDVAAMVEAIPVIAKSQTKLIAEALRRFSPDQKEFSYQGNPSIWPSYSLLFSDYDDGPY